MPRRFIRFNIPHRQSKRELFLRDPKADFIVILEKKIFPLHKQLLAPSAYFQELIQSNKKSVSIDSHVNVDFFEQILGCFYGIEAAFERHNIILHILDILSLLRVKVLDQELKNDMIVNFEEYGLFNLFYLSRKFKLKDVQEKCLKQLIDQGFEQINYNKYDLFQLNPQLFTCVLKQHQRLKAFRSIQGLDSAQIKAVCEQYCKTNSVKIDLDEIMNFGKYCLKQQLEEGLQPTPPVRKRNGTWTNSTPKEEEVAASANQSQKLSLDTKIYSFQEKENDVMKIRMIYSNMQEKNHKLAAEIQSVKSSIDNSNASKDLSYGVDDLDKKLKQFQQKSKNAHKKMEQLKQKMMKIKQDEVVTKQVKTGKIISEGIYRGGSGIKNNRLMPQMAVLQKSQCLDSDQSDY